jgi:hypothetical protein
VAGGRRRGPDESTTLRTARERQQHLVQVEAYRFSPARGTRRSATVTPAPLRYWQYDPARPWLVATVLAVVAAWLGTAAWVGGPSAVAGEAPVAVPAGLAVLVLSTTRLTVSDAGVSSDLAGLLGASSRHVLAVSQVLEVRRGTPPADWPEAARRGGWWPGRTPVAVRHLSDDGTTEQVFTTRVRNPEAFAEALGRPLG